MYHILCCLAVFGLGVVMTSCATTTVSDEPRGIAAFEGDPRLGEKVDKICFQRNIDGFSDARRDTVVLSAGASKDYIVSVRGVCQNLAFAQTVGTAPRTSCLRDDDFIIVSQSGFSLNDRNSIGPNRCYIDEIYEWNSRATGDDSATNNSEP